MKINEILYQQKRLIKGLIQGEVHDETVYMLNGVSGNGIIFYNWRSKEFLHNVSSKGKYKGKTIIPSDMIDTLFNYNFMGRTLGWQRWNKIARLCGIQDLLEHQLRLI